MTVLGRLSDVLRCVNNHTDALTRLSQSSFQAHSLDGGMVRVQNTQHNFLHRTAAVALISGRRHQFEGVFVQPAVVFWPRWLVYTEDAELAMGVKVEEAALNSASQGE